MLVLLQLFGAGRGQHDCPSCPQGLQCADWQEYHGLEHEEPQHNWLGAPQFAQVSGTVPKSQVLFDGEQAGEPGQQSEPIAVPHAWQVPAGPAVVLQARRGVSVVLQMFPAQQGCPCTPHPWQIFEASQMSPAPHTGVSQQCCDCAPQMLLQVAPAQNSPGALPHQLPGQQEAPAELPQLLLHFDVASQKRPTLQVFPGVQQFSPWCPQNWNEPWEPDDRQFTSSP